MRVGIHLASCVSFRNQTIRFMPIPIIDAAQALKASPEKTEDALLKVKVHIWLHGRYYLVTEFEINSH